LFVSAPFSGIQVFVENLRKVVEKMRGIEPTWVWLEHEPKEFITRIPPISFNYTLKGGMASRIRVRSLEKNGKRFDAAFFNHMVPPAFLGEFRRRVPTVMSLDVTPPLLEPFARWYRGKTNGSAGLIDRIKFSFTRTLYMDATYLLPWSEVVKDSLVEHYHVPSDKVHTVPPGIDLERWKSPARRNSREKLKVLFVGGDFQRKGGDLLLKIAHREEFKRHEFHFVTKSFMGQKGDNVFVHEDVQPNSNELHRLYHEADVFAMPTRADFCPTNALCEAMSMGLPVITTSVGGLNEIVTDGENGFLVPTDDENALAQRLMKLCANGNLRNRLGQKGRQRIDIKYNLKKNAEIIVSFLKAAADRMLTGDRGVASFAHS